MGRNRTDKTKSCPCPPCVTLPGFVPVSNRGRTDRQNLVLTKGQTIYPPMGVIGCLSKGQEKRSEAGSSTARRTPFFLHLTKATRRI